MVFVYQGAPDQGPMFFDGLFPEATAIADPDGELYEAFAVRRGGWREMFGLGSWRAALAALRSGHFVNRKIGDPWTLPTLVVVARGEIVWEHHGSHAGDHPDLAALADQVRVAA